MVYVNKFSRASLLKARYLSLASLLPSFSTWVWTRHGGSTGDSGGGRSDSRAGEFLALAMLYSMSVNCHSMLYIQSLPSSVGRREN